MDQNIYQNDEGVFSKNSVRDAMKLWHNLEALAERPLAQLKIVRTKRLAAGYPDTSLGRGRFLREVLEEALKSLKPEDVEPNLIEGLGDEWQYYIFLRERYTKEKGYRKSPVFL